MPLRRIIAVFLPPIRRARRIVVGCVVVMDQQMLVPDMLVIAISMMVMFDLECHKRAKPINHQDQHHQDGGNHVSEYGQQLHRRGGIYGRLSMCQGVFPEGWR
jgi:hypothetical protein